MDWVTPANMWFIGLAVPIVVLYFLKLRRQPVAVGSTLLWEQALEDLRVNSPFQRIRNSLLMWLQLLALLLLVLALTRLFVEGQTLKGDRIIVLLDTSASMQTKEEGTDPLRAAKNTVRDLINAMAQGDQIELMTFDTRAQLRVSFTSGTTSFVIPLRVSPSPSRTTPCWRSPFTPPSKRAQPGRYSWTRQSVLRCRAQ